MGKYILNKETQKLELHFDKAEYMALSDAQKREIKSTFLWSRYAGAWVSRSKNNHYFAVRIAEKLGLENGGEVGERLSFAEELERKAERAEHRADRFEQYAENAEKRAESLQAELNRYRGDTAFFTQPIIAGHAGSQAFSRHRERIFERYRKGFDEYRKSEYFQDRAETARATADMRQLKNPVYLHNRIKECNANIRAFERAMVRAEEQNNEDWQNRLLEKMEYEIDKLAYMKNCLDEIGGNKYSKDNVKVGYIVKMRRWGRCEIVGTGPVNVTFRILDGGAAGGCLTEPYVAIAEILEAKEAKQNIENPYNVGDILCAHRPVNDSIYRAYQVVKTTPAGVKLQQIAVENGVPILGKFISDKQVLRKIVKSKWSDWIGVYMDDWQLHKYTGKKEATS
jgi:hypothetical protein